MAQRLTVEIVGDASSLERTFRKTSRDANRFEASITGLGRSMARGFVAAGAAFFSAQGLIRGLESSISAASDLNEQMSKTGVVFDQSAAEIQAWSRTTATAFGLSQRQALATASSFGAIFAPLGIAGNEAARQSQRLTELGADLASFYNTDVQDALDAIRSGIVGESEPLRRYGILLSESRVQAEALAETGKRTAASLTAQEKVTARLNLIMRDSKQAQGDFARTSGGLANQQRILTAQIDNLQASLGEALLPTITNLVTKLNVWLADTDNQKQLQSDLTTIVEDAATAVIGLANAYDKLHNAMESIRSLPGKGPSLLDMLGLTKKGSGDFGGGGDFTAADLASGLPKSRFFFTDTPPSTGAPFRPGGSRGPRGVTAGQRNQWFDAMIARLLGRANDPTSLRQQIARLRTVAGLIQQRLAVTKDITRRLTLEDQLADIAISIRDRQQQITDKARSQARADQAAARERQFGWLDFAIERAEATKTLADDRRALRAKERFLRELIRSEGRSLELVQELWRTRQKIRDLNKQNADVDPLAGLMQVSSRRMAALLGAGLGLNAAGLGRLQANIAGQEIHNYVYLDGHQVASSVNRANAQTGHRTARQTSGFRG